MATMTMRDVIERAHQEWSAYDIKEDRQQLYAHIAAAVAAHLASEAVVERVGMVLRDEYEQDYAIAAWPNLNASDRAAFMASARAAITAALGEHEGPKDAGNA